MKDQPPHTAVEALTRALERFAKVARERDADMEALGLVADDDGLTLYEIDSTLTLGDCREAERALLLHGGGESRSSLPRCAHCVAVDGPHAPGEQRFWLARNLMDSKLSDAEAFGVVAFHPDIQDLISAPRDADG